MISLAKLFRYHLTIDISESVKNLFQIYSAFDHEVGGALFGKKAHKTVSIRSISIKHGSIVKIEFENNDLQIFYPPKDNLILGTWHLHPGLLSNRPSLIDISQWRVWGPNYFHTIINCSNYAIYRSDATLITEGQIYG